MSNHKEPMTLVRASASSGCIPHMRWNFMSYCSLEAHSLNYKAKKTCAAAPQIIYQTTSFTRCLFMGAIDLNGKKLCSCAFHLC